MGEHRRYNEDIQKPEVSLTSHPTGAELVEVRVHALTREIRVPRIVDAFAAGRIMNTRTARSQYMGAMIWGILSALLEATELNLADNLVPVLVG